MQQRGLTAFKTKRRRTFCPKKCNRKSCPVYLTTQAELKYGIEFYGTHEQAEASYGVVCVVVSL